MIDNFILSAHSARDNKRTLKEEKSKRATLEPSDEDKHATTGAFMVRLLNACTKS